MTIVRTFNDDDDVCSGWVCFAADAPAVIRPHLSLITPIATYIPNPLVPNPIPARTRAFAAPPLLLLLLSPKP